MKRACFVGKREVKKPFGRSRPRWEDNNKIYLIKNWGWKSCTAFTWLRRKKTGGII
jgi:hypothetical protein